MPMNKNQIRRIQTILKMMRQNRYPNYNSFCHEMKNQDPAGTFNLSSKTFSRDIADLRDEYGAPVKYDASRKGFYLTNTEWYNEELMVEPFEMKSVLLGERVAGSIFPDPLRREVNKAVGALLMKNETGMAEGAELENFQVLCPPNLPFVSPDIFLTAYNAWEQRRFLELVYRSSRNRVAKKLFEPHIFAWNGGCWYLKGKLLRDDDEYYEPVKIQVLALHRIEKAEIIPDKQFYPDPAILKTVKESGLFDFEKIPEVVLEILHPFDQSYAAGFADKITARGDDFIRVSLKNVPKYEALQLIFSCQGNVRILAPDDLKDQVRRITEKMLENLKD